MFRQVQMSQANGIGKAMPDGPFLSAPHALECEYKELMNPGNQPPGLVMRNWILANCKKSKNQ